MRRWIAASALALWTSAQSPAQIPSQEARNHDLPNGRMHFQMPVYRTLAE